MNPSIVFLIVGIGALGAWLFQQNQTAQENSGDILDAPAIDPQAQTDQIDNSQIDPNMQTPQSLKNVSAFLAMISHAEGTDYPNGYRYLFGSGPGHEKLFDNFAAHPNRSFPFTINGITKNTTAAGKYQINKPTWDDINHRLIQLPDFSPASQDAAAIALLKDCGAYSYIITGDFQGAVDKASARWASLPGSTSGQPQRGFDSLLAYFQNSGGATA